MKSNYSARFLGSCVYVPQTVRGNGVLIVLCVAAFLLLSVTNVFAPRRGGYGGAGRRVEAPGVGVAGTGAESAQRAQSAPRAESADSAQRAQPAAAAATASRTAAAGVGAGARGYGVAPGVGVGSPGAGVLPHGYIYTIPAGYTRVYYRGYWCAYVDGVYYVPAYYQGVIVYRPVT